MSRHVFILNRGWGTFLSKAILTSAFMAHIKIFNTSYQTSLMPITGAASFWWVIWHQIIGMMMLLEAGYPGLGQLGCGFSCTSAGSTLQRSWNVQFLLFTFHILFRLMPDGVRHTHQPNCHSRLLCSRKMHSVSSFQLHLPQPLFCFEWSSHLKAESWEVSWDLDLELKIQLVAAFNQIVFVIDGKI